MKWNELRQLSFEMLHKQNNATSNRIEWINKEKYRHREKKTLHLSIDLSMNNNKCIYENLSFLIINHRHSLEMACNFCISCTACVCVKIQFHFETNRSTVLQPQNESQKRAHSQRKISQMQMWFVDFYCVSNCIWIQLTSSPASYT